MTDSKSTVLPRHSRHVKLSLSLPREMVDAIDKACDAAHIKRSRYIAMLLRQAMAESGAISSAELLGGSTSGVPFGKRVQLAAAASVLPFYLDACPSTDEAIGEALKVGLAFAERAQRH